MEFTLTCALASYAADGVLAEILEDNRAGRQVQQWREVAKDELSYIRSLDEGFAMAWLPGALQAP
eukprot:7488580-Lingulodinium_polyedra.AAC.1